MSDEGVVQLQNTGQEMRLLVEGDVPIDSLPRPSTIKFIFNGALLAEVTAREARAVRVRHHRRATRERRMVEAAARLRSILQSHQLNPKSRRRAPPQLFIDQAGVGGEDRATTVRLKI